MAGGFARLMVSAGPTDGFSLVELLVVIAIVVILGAIAANMLLIGRSTDEPQTRVLLARVQSIAETYLAETGEPVSDEGLEVDFTPEEEKEVAIARIEKFVETARGRPSTKQMLEALGSEALVDKDRDGVPEIYDTWGNPLVYVGPTALAVSPSSSQFMHNPHPYFASAGADGDFGDFSVRDSDGNPTDPALRDNLYSFYAEKRPNPKGP